MFNVSLSAKTEIVRIFNKTSFASSDLVTTYFKLLISILSLNMVIFTQTEFLRYILTKYPDHMKIRFFPQTPH